jgi:CBS domain-containing protein
MSTMTIEELLRIKESKEIWAVTPEATVFEALQTMADRNIGALLVMVGDRLVGVFSERDYARKIILKGKSSLETPVREVMSTEIVTISPNMWIEECMELMTDYHIRHLPVVDGDHLLGMVSIGDIVKAIISGQARFIASLENYISGRDYGRI